MITPDGWKFPSLEEQKHIVDEIYADGRTVVNMLELGFLIGDAIRRATSEERKGLREELLRQSEARAEETARLKAIRLAREVQQAKQAATRRVN
jgi:hypothetical protein